MRKILILLIILLLIPTISANNNLYNKEYLDLELIVNGNFELKAESNQAKVSEVIAELLLFPKNNYRQEVLELDSLGKVEANQINFKWQDKKIEEKKFSYSAYIRTKNQRKKVKEKIKFPIPTTKIKDYTEFLKPTKSIDSNNQKIISKAAELAEGEKDLFKVTFKLANWVEKNVNYELNSITAKASKKASWVLENKKGVCDEMTSLFIAMARSLGIPARFASGISYSTSELFNEPWQPHGWAEIYFPEVGWVSFDITFGEYGYIDVTHIKLRDGFDPTDPATKFEWIAQDVNIKTSPLDFQVKIKKEGGENGKEILLEQELLGKRVGFESYNLVKGILENTKDYYVTTTLKLNVPKEIIIKGKDKRTIILAPKEKKETFWIIKLSNDLKNDYSYQFPTMIYSERNSTVIDSFSAKEGDRIYSKKEVEELAIEIEDKVYSNLVNINCNHKNQIKLNKNLEIKCQIKNQGNSNLKNIEFCIGQNCEKIDLLINQKKEKEVSIKQKEVGWNIILVSAKNELIEKKQLIQFSVLDQSNIKLEIEAPYSVNYEEKIQITTRLNKNSFSQPQNISVILSGSGFTNRWNIDKLNQKTELPLELENFPIAKNNKFFIQVNWKDVTGEKHLEEKEVIVLGKANNFKNKMKLYLNSLINLFK